MLARLAAATRSNAIATLDGATLLGERAMLGGMKIPARTSAGGGCRLFDAADDTIALNLARAADRELLPALFETGALDPGDDEAIAAQIRRRDATWLVDRGRSMGLAIAAEGEMLGWSPSAGSWPGEDSLVGTRTPDRSMTPRVLDLSALWAGPLAAHLLWLAGSQVIKVESRTRPDAMRQGTPSFYSLLNQGKASVALDFRDPNDRQALLALIASSDIVIEAARPRALQQLGIDAAEIVRKTPGLVWMTLTGHGATGEAAHWVGFGDDCGVSGGLSAALRSATGHSGFVGDAIADPLTGMLAAVIAWESWSSGRGGRFGLAMSRVVAQCLATAREQDPTGLTACLKSWRAAVGKPFPIVQRRPIGSLADFGADTHTLVSRTHDPCKAPFGVGTSRLR